MLIVIFLLLLTLLPSIQAATITAASSSYTDVNTAVNTTASAGDTVEIPNGTSTWNSTLTITKAITLKAQNAQSNDSDGRASVCNVKITGTSSPVISIHPSSGNPSIRVTGVQINGSVNSDGIQIVNNSSSSGLNQIRIDHNVITNCSASSANGVNFGDPNFICVDHNTFANNQIHLRCLGNSGASWTAFPASPGNANKPYIEDNTFNQTTTAQSFLSESGQGGRFVFRFNIVNFNIAAGFWEIHDMHGNNGSVVFDNRGTVEFEIYNNTYTFSTSIARWINYRGGSGKIFNNTITIGGGSLSFEMTEYDGWSACDWVAKPNYPADDPVTDAFIFANLKDGSGFTPSLANPTACGCTSSGSDRCDAFFIQLDRDYFLPPSGLDAGRPGGSDGDYYAATDTRKIYHKVSGSWLTPYAAYTYPHPLQGGGGAASSPANGFLGNTIRSGNTR